MNLMESDKGQQESQHNINFAEGGSYMYMCVVK